MRLGLDLHGVVSDIPDTMKKLSAAIIISGGEVHILTGSTTSRAITELSELGFEHGTHYTHVMGLPDYLMELGYQPTGVDEKYDNATYPTEIWDSAKATYCHFYKVDLHLDDTVEYGDTFVTPFARLWTKDK